MDANTALMFNETLCRIATALENLNYNVKQQTDMQGQYYMAWIDEAIKNDKENTIGDQSKQNSL
jgi:hypothetical protein